MSDKLEQILRKWSAQNEADDDRINQLARRISTEAVQARTKTNTPTSLFSVWHKLLYAGCGAVVAAAISVLCFHFFLENCATNAATDNGTRLADISEEKMAASRKLFAEMNKLFPEQLRWISESNGDICLGIESLAINDSEQSTPVLVKLTVVSRETGNKRWRPAWNTYVLLRGEEMVEIARNDASGNRLALWVYPLEEGKLAVDTDISMNTPVRIASTASKIVKPGQPTKMASFKTVDKEYNLYQTVLAL